MKRFLQGLFLIIAMFAANNVGAQTWQWGKHFGSSYQVPSNLYETINGIGLDSSGNIYTAGTVMQLPAIDDSSIATSHGPYFQGFLAKHDCAGNRKWIQMFLSNDQNDNVSGLTVDEIGNCYITGRAANTTEYFGANTYNFGNPPGWYLAKYDSSGNFQWVTFSQTTPGALNERGSTIDINSQGTIIAAGFNEIQGNVFPGINLKRGNFIAAFNPNSGTAIWGINVDTMPPTARHFQLLSLAVDNSDNIYVAGGFNDTVRIGSYVFTAPSLGSHALLAKYNPIGTLQWAMQGQGASNNDGIAVITSSSNYIYAFASALDNDTLFGYPITVNGSQIVGYVMLKFDGSGNLMDGITRDSMNALYAGKTPSFAKDDDGNIYFTDGFRGKLKWGNYPSITANAGTNGSPYLLKLNSSLQVQSLLRVPGPGGFYDAGQAIAVNDDGDVYIGGSVSQSIIVGSDTVYNYGNTGTDNDLFLLKYGGACPVITGMDETVGNIVIEGSDVAIIHSFPNPSQGEFEILVSTQTEIKGEVILVNSIGQEAMNYPITLNNSILKLSVRLPELSQGLYYIVLRSDKGNVYKKISVVK